MRTVPSHLLSRPVLLELCAHYLEQDRYEEGLQLLQALFTNIAKEECPSSGRPSVLGNDHDPFRMVVQLLADGGRTVYSSTRPDPELVVVADRADA